MDAGRMVRLAAESVVSTRRVIMDFVYTGPRPMSFAIELCRRHESVRKSYEAAIRSGEVVVHTFRKVAGKDPAVPLGCAPELERRMLHADACLVASVALLEALTSDTGATLKSRSRGVLDLSYPEVVKAYPSGYKNPLLSWEGVNNSGFMWSLITPDETGVHMWVRCVGTGEDGQTHVVNLDPTIHQFGEGFSPVWFGEEHTCGTLRFNSLKTAGDAYDSLQLDITSNTMAREMYGALLNALGV